MKIFYTLWNIIRDTMPMRRSNSYIIVIGYVCFVILGTSCSSLKNNSSSSKPPISVYKDKETKEDQKKSEPTTPTQKKDTVTVQSKESTNETNYVKKEHIHVAVALPLDAGYDITRFAEFINGMHLGAKNTKGSKPTISIHIKDVGNINDAKTLMNMKEFSQCDIIIGGYQTSQVKTLAEIAQAKKIPYISPWNTTSDIIQDNPFYIQLKPSFEQFCNRTANYVAKSIRPEMTILLLSSTNGKDYIAKSYFEDVFKNHRLPYKTFVVNGNQEDWVNEANKHSNIVVLVPNWDNLSFIQQTLRQASKLKVKSLQVGGMPQWTDFDQLDFNLLHINNVFIPQFNYIDNAEMTTSLLRDQYISTYNDIPTQDAYYGYDVMKMVKSVATSISEGKSVNPVNLLSGKYISHYDVRPFNRAAQDNQLNDHPAYFHNTSITILKFEGGKFVPVQ